MSERYLVRCDEAGGSSKSHYVTFDVDGIPLFVCREEAWRFGNLESAENFVKSAETRYRSWGGYFIEPEESPFSITCFPTIHDPAEETA